MKRKIVFWVISAYFILFALAAAGYGVYWYVFDRPPVQPIAFSHKVHTTTVGLDCTKCHAYADRGTLPGIPAVSVCMECHVNVKVNSPEVKKLAEYWEKKEPIPWVKVHGWRESKNVGFTHKSHIRYFTEKDGVAVSEVCAKCHGDVSGMDEMRQVSSLKMGWCVSCHVENEASIDCWTCHK